MHTYFAGAGNLRPNFFASWTGTVPNQERGLPQTRGIFRSREHRRQETQQRSCHRAINNLDRERARSRKIEEARRDRRSPMIQAAVAAPLSLALIAGYIIDSSLDGGGESPDWSENGRTLEMTIALPFVF